MPPKRRPSPSITPSAESDSRREWTIEYVTSPRAAGRSCGSGSCCLFDSGAMRGRRSGIHAAAVNAPDRRGPPCGNRKFPSAFVATGTGGVAGRPHDFEWAGPLRPRSGIGVDNDPCTVVGPHEWAGRLPRPWHGSAFRPSRDLARSRERRRSRTNGQSRRRHCPGASVEGSHWSYPKQACDRTTRLAPGASRCPDARLAPALIRYAALRPATGAPAGGRVDDPAGVGGSPCRGGSIPTRETVDRCPPKRCGRLGRDRSGTLRRVARPVPFAIEKAHCLPPQQRQ